MRAGDHAVLVPVWSRPLPPCCLGAGGPAHSPTLSCTLHHAQLAATLAVARGADAEAATWHSELSSKRTELLATAILEEGRAQQRLRKHTDKVCGRGPC